LYAIQEANSYTLQLKNFADVVAGRAEPLIPLSQSVVNTFVTEGLVESALSKDAATLAIPENVVAAYKGYLDDLVGEP